MDKEKYTRVQLFCSRLYDCKAVQVVQKKSLTSPEFIFNTYYNNSVSLSVAANTICGVQNNTADNILRLLACTNQTRSCYIEISCHFKAMFRCDN